MKLLNLLLVIVCILGLIGVRVVENHLFYDPLLLYFKSSNVGNPFPEIVYIKLIFGHLFRFVLNLMFSAVIIHLIFKNILWTKQAVILMVMVFALVFPMYLYCVYTEFYIGELFAFYIRRFVIQPITLLIIVPLYYYRKHYLGK